MFEFLLSIFAGGADSSGYSEEVVKGAIERAVDGTDPWIRAISGYRKKLRPAVIRSLDHAAALVDALAPATTATVAEYGDNPLLRAFFSSREEMRRILDSEPNLKKYRQAQEINPGAAFGLLVVDRHESMIQGVELSGEIVMRDALQPAVSFECHRLVDLSGSEEETRRRLKERAYNHILGLALARVVSMKTERGKLKQYRALLRSKLSLIENSGWGFDRKDAEDSMGAGEIETMLKQIDAELLEPGGDERVLDAYLNVVIEVLAHPEEHLRVQKERLILDRMGIKRREPAFDAPEMILDTMHDSQGRCRVLSLVELPG